MVPWHLQPKYQTPVKPTGKDAPTDSLTKEHHLQQLGYRTYQRYYHVFRKDELTRLFSVSGQPVQVTEEYYDHDNWCVVAVKETVLPDGADNRT